MTNMQTTAPATDHIIIHADGACLGNPGVGGWAFTKTLGEKTVRRSGGVAGMTTNNQMEMIAVLQAVRSLKRPGIPAMVFTDSEYVVKGLTEWLPRWIANGWRGSGKKPVANRELWEALSEARDAHSAGITLRWVPGHAGIQDNEQVDAVANAEAEKAAARVGSRPTISTIFEPDQGLIIPNRHASQAHAYSNYCRRQTSR